MGTKQSKALKATVPFLATDFRGPASVFHGQCLVNLQADVHAPRCCDQRAQHRLGVPTITRLELVATSSPRTSSHGVQYNTNVAMYLMFLPK